MTSGVDGESFAELEGRGACIAASVGRFAGGWDGVGGVAFHRMGEGRRVVDMGEGRQLEFVLSASTSPLQSQRALLVVVKLWQAAWLQLPIPDPFFLTHSLASVLALRSQNPLLPDENVTGLLFYVPYQNNNHTATLSPN